MKLRVTSPPPHLDAFNIDRHIAYEKVANLHTNIYLQKEQNDSSQFKVYSAENVKPRMGSLERVALNG